MMKLLFSETEGPAQRPAVGLLLLDLRPGDLVFEIETLESVKRFLGHISIELIARIGPIGRAMGFAARVVVAVASVGVYVRKLRVFVGRDGEKAPPRRRADVLSAAGAVMGGRQIEIDERRRKCGRGARYIETGRTERIKQCGLGSLFGQSETGGLEVIGIEIDPGGRLIVTQIGAGQHQREPHAVLRCGAVRKKAAP